MITLREFSAEAARDWNYELNDNLTPDNVSANSDKKVWFTCPSNRKHTYPRVIRTVVNKKGEYVGCPFCRGLKAFPGETDLFTKCPEAKIYWDFDMNPLNVVPTKLLINSTYVAHFKCEEGHKFRKKIKCFVKNPVCKKCTTSTLSDYSPEALQEWDDERNVGMTPETVSVRSDKEAYFVCRFNPKHKYNRRIGKVLDRKYKFIGCPYCNGSKVFPGETDFFTKCPEAKEFWDYDNNPIDLDPTKLFPHSKVKAHFICQNGHEFIKRIVDFTRTPRCLECEPRQYSGHISKSLREHSSEATRDWAYSLNGSLTPDNVSYGSDKKAWFICIENPKHIYPRTINAVINSNGQYIGCPYCNGSKVFPGETDFFTKCPEAKKFWDYDKNPIDLKPTKLFPHSAVKAHFICQNGHKFTKKIGDFTATPKCLKCSFVSIMEYSPEAARDWDNYKNGNLIPSEVSYKANIEVHFKCNKNSKHKYKRYLQSIINKNGEYVGCPYCNGTRAFPGETDLFTICPDAKEFWDFKNNPKNLNPEHKLPTSHNVANFKCSHGHQFTKQIRRFVENPVCPECSKKTVREYSQEATRDWDNERNGKLTPDNLTIGQNIKVYFKCENNPLHRYDRLIGNTINKKGKYIGCPYCNGTRAFPGETDLFTVCPKAKEWWDIDKNPKDLIPINLLPNSNFKAYFKCEKGHQFPRVINDFTSNPTCPYCNDSFAVPGETDFFTICQEAKDFWDYEMNSTDLNPNNILPFSTITANFKCSVGHHFTKKIAEFTHSPTCPICSYSKIEPSINSLKAEFPELIELEWNHLANLLLGNPENISPFSKSTFFWNCQICGSVYPKSASSRIKAYTRKRNICPTCNGRRYKYINY